MSNDLSVFKKNDRKILEQIAGKKGGRPRKEESEKLSEKITVNFTPTEKEKLVERSKSMGGVPLTTLIRNALAEHGYI